MNIQSLINFRKGEKSQNDVNLFADFDFIALLSYG